MNALQRVRTCLPVAVAGVACLLMVACDSGERDKQAEAKAATESKAGEAPENKVAETSTTSELAGSSWQLVGIASMDDKVEAPADPALYTLEFNADGSASMQADCNRGSGTWKSESSGQLSFGPIAATRAMCPPQSISDTYLAQFEWVRSYVMTDGHLFLTTMADGSIIELAPATTGAAVASVLGQKVLAGEAAEVQEAILTPLFDRYAEQKGITVDNAEIAAYVEKMRSESAGDGSTGESELSAEEAQEIEAMRKQMGRALIRQWKINKALYSQYGGRLIYQQFGPEPLDAYRQFLKEQQAAGAFSFNDPSAEQAFWKYFRDESLHEFMASGSEDETTAYSVSPWE